MNQLLAKMLHVKNGKQWCPNDHGITKLPCKQWYFLLRVRTLSTQACSSDRIQFNISWTWVSGAAPGTPEAPVVPDSDLRANSVFFLWKPISISCRTMGAGGTGEVLCFFCLGGRICCTVTGVVASLELLSSNRGEDGCVDSTARYWHTARAAA